MFKGKREIEAHILVDQKASYKFDDKHGKRWIEIKVPPEDPSCYHTKTGRPHNWPSFMVNPTQVYFVPNTEYNIVALNKNSLISISNKNQNHVPVTTEYLTPKQIIGRWIKYYIYTMSDPTVSDNSEEIYNQYKASGQTILAYVTALNP